MTPFAQHCRRNLLGQIKLINSGDLSTVRDKHRAAVDTDESRAATAEALSLIAYQTAQAIAYDFSAVTALVSDTCEQLTAQQAGKAALMGIELKPGGAQLINDRDREALAFIEHGGLFVPPAGVLWVQWAIATHRLAVLMMRNHDDPTRQSYDILAVFYETLETRDRHINMMVAGLLVDYTEESFTIRPDVRFTNRLDEKSSRSTQAMAQYALAAIIVLNAPYGIERQTPPLHKGQARELRREGVTLKPHHVIRLSHKPPPEEAMRGEGSSKAFHFVRSHRRQYQSGLVISVKAHFRGDPRLGMTTGPYAVRA